MRRELVIAKIRDNAAAIQALGVASLYLYGSHARDEAQSGSDVDVFIDRNPDQRFGFIELTEIEFLLQDILGVGRIPRDAQRRTKDNFVVALVELGNPRQRRR